MTEIAGAWSALAYLLTLLRIRRTSISTDPRRSHD